MSVVIEQIEEAKSRMRHYELIVSSIGKKQIDSISYSDKLKYYNAKRAYLDNLRIYNRISKEELIENNSDIIGLGSIFNATICLDGVYNETANYIISDENISVEGYIVINMLAPITKAMLGKSENDTFSYEVNSNIITGKINKVIKKEKKVYRLGR